MVVGAATIEKARASSPEVRIVGRYAVHGMIASGGMGTIHLGRLLGGAGFSRVVAIKRMHARFAEDPEFVEMFVDEAKLAARVRHACVVPMLDVVVADGEVLLVMELIHGESLSKLSRTSHEMTRVPVHILASVLGDALRGLHAVHEATDERGEPLGIVHRDVSPQNILVGEDGISRLIDFGVAKAIGHSRTTQPNSIKGKIGYLSPERLTGAVATRAVDIFAAGVVAWESLTGQRLFTGSEPQILDQIMRGAIERPSRMVPRAMAKEIEHLDGFVLCALAKDPRDRFESALEMALELERRAPAATRSAVTAFVRTRAHEVLSKRARMLSMVEMPSAPQPITNGEPAVIEECWTTQSSVMKRGRKLRIGLVLPASKEQHAHVETLTRFISDRAGIQLEHRLAGSYEALTADMAQGKVAFAWLPPLVFLRLPDVVTVIGSIVREGQSAYESVLVVKRSSGFGSIRRLRGARAGWVDPWSASGFVMPRLGLMERGIDPRTLFRTERFYGSHRGAVDALCEGACDVAGTYARTVKGRTVGAWGDADVEVIARFGSIPPDVIAAHRDVDPIVHARLADTLRLACKEQRESMRAIFGGCELKTAPASGYDTLTTAIGSAKLRGLFD